MSGFGSPSKKEPSKKDKIINQLYLENLLLIQILFKICPNVKFEDLSKEIDKQVDEIIETSKIINNASKRFYNLKEKMEEKNDK